MKHCSPQTLSQNRCSRNMKHCSPKSLPGVTVSYFPRCPAVNFRGDSSCGDCSQLLPLLPPKIRWTRSALWERASRSNVPIQFLCVGAKFPGVAGAPTPTLPELLCWRWSLSLFRRGRHLAMGTVVRDFQRWGITDLTVGSFVYTCILCFHSYPFLTRVV
jgi:hypothetical protein